jgi:hypothetical protein
MRQLYLKSSTYSVNQKYPQLLPILPLILLPGITHPSSRAIPAALKELLALVNNPSSPPSESHQQHEEGSRGSWIGELEGYGDIFGDHITKKEKNVLRIGFQNRGGFPIDI